MNSMSITYTLKFELDFSPNYKWTDCGKCFNTITGKQIKQVYNKGSIGYSINGKFKSLKFLRTKLQRINPVSCPF